MAASYNPPTKPLGNDTEIYAAYLRSTEFFTQINEYQKIRSTPGQGVITGATKLQAELQNFQDGLTRRVDICVAKVREAVEVKNAELLHKKYLETEATKTHVLTMGEKTNPPNAEMDWGRDTNNSTTTIDDDDVLRRIEAAQHIIDKYMQLLHCVGSFSCGLGWAVEYLVSNVQMDEHEAGEWLETTKFCKAHEMSSDFDWKLLRRSVNEWAESEAMKKVMAKHTEVIQAYTSEIGAKKVEIFETDSSLVNKQWYDKHGQLMCQYCYKSGADYHPKEECPAATYWGPRKKKIGVSKGMRW